MGPKRRSQMDTKAICGFCRRGPEVAKICGHLYVAESAAAHKKCMQYSAGLVQYHHKIGFGGFKLDKVLAELARGNKLKCSLCKIQQKKKSSRRGATAGCSWTRCVKTFHYYCAAVSDTTVVRRMEVEYQDKKQHKVVEYRIFCSKKHEQLYLQSKAEEMHHIRTPEEESGSSGTDYDGEDLVTTTNLENSFETDSSWDSNDDQAASNPPSKGKLNSQKKRVRAVENESSSSDESGPVERKKVRKQATKNISCSKDEITNDEEGEKYSEAPLLDNDATSRSSSSSGDKEQSKDLQLSDSDDMKTASPSDANSNPLPQMTDNNAQQNAIGTLTPVQKNSNQSGKPETSKQKAKKKLNVHKEDGAKADKSQEMQKLELNLSHKTDCVLCFTEMTDVPAAFEKRLKRYIDKVFHIPSSSVCIWTHDKFRLSREQIVYLLKDLSLALRQQQYNQFQQLVLSLKEEDMNKYSYIIDCNESYPEDLASTLYVKLRDSIKENLQVAGEVLDKVIGLYCRVQYRHEHIRIAFIVLNGTTDPGAMIRKAMQKRFGVYVWNEKTKAQVYDMIMTAEARSREFNIMRQWLEGADATFIDARPWEPLMAGDQSSSTTVELLKYFQERTKCTSIHTRLIFVRPLDECILVSSGYLRKLLMSLFCDDDEQTNIVIFDLQPDLETTEEILRGLPTGIKSKVLTAFNPANHAVSCVILKLTRARSAVLINTKSLTQDNPKTDSADEVNEAEDGHDDYIDMCEIIKEDPPTETISFTPPDIKWRLLQCNKLGLKMVKISATNAILETRTIGIPSLTHKVRGDGNCFFRALSQEITGTQNQYGLVRKKLVNYMVKHASIFEKYFNLKDIHTYLEESKMAENSTWATDTEIIAMATMLDTYIVIFTKVGTCYKWLSYGPVSGSSSHTCRVYLVNKGHHFDLVLDVQAVAS